MKCAHSLILLLIVLILFMNIIDAKKTKTKIPKILIGAVENVVEVR